MFNGQLKEKYYSEMLKMYAEARKKIINDLFGDIEDSK